MGKGERGVPQLGKGPLQVALKAPLPSPGSGQAPKLGANSGISPRVEVTAPTPFAVLATHPPLSERLGLNRTISDQTSELYMLWPVRPSLLLRGSGGWE